jgi:hypothetical protein
LGESHFGTLQKKKRNRKTPLLTPTDEISRCSRRELGIIILPVTSDNSMHHRKFSSSKPTHRNVAYIDKGAVVPQKTNVTVMEIDSETTTTIGCSEPGIKDNTVHAMKTPVTASRVGRRSTNLVCMIVKIV